MQRRCTPEIGFTTSFRGKRTENTAAANERTAGQGGACHFADVPKASACIATSDAFSGHNPVHAYAFAENGREDQSEVYCKTPVANVL